MSVATTQRLLTEEEQEWIKDMANDLPPVIARKQIGKFLGGVIAPQTLSNADARGDGPEVAYKIGRGVAYKTQPLLTWIVQQFGVSKIQNLKKDTKILSCIQQYR